MARLTWVLAVAGLMNSRLAISELDSEFGDQPPGDTGGQQRVAARG